MANQYDWQGQAPFKYTVKILGTNKSSEKDVKKVLLSVLGVTLYSKLTDIVYSSRTSGVQFSLPTAEDVRQARESIKRLLPKWNLEPEGMHTQKMKLNKRTYNKMKRKFERDFKIISHYTNIEIFEETKGEQVHVIISGHNEQDIQRAKDTIDDFYKKSIDADAVADYAPFEFPDATRPALKPKPRSKKAASDTTNNWRHPCVHMESNYGTNVMVYKGDITTLKVDIVVNAANGYMGHGGGVAAAISQAAGPALEQECLDKLQEQGEEVKPGNYITTTAGKMPSKQVIHAVAPRYTDYSEPAECLEVLYNTVYVSLQYANRFNSIAIPALGSGIFGIPKEDVARRMCHAVTDFCSRQTNLKQIHLIDIDDEMIELLKKEILSKTYQSELTFEAHMYNSATKRKKKLHPDCPL